MQRIPLANRFRLRAIDSMTKYPSIDTYHRLQEGTGLLLEDHVQFEANTVIATEKIDGTNARIIVFPDGDFIIGSRKELLHAKGDRIINPALGIVDTVLLPAWEICLRHHEHPTVYYGEVYGHGVQGGKAYTSTPGQTGFRLFDVAILDRFEELVHWEPQELASWRDNGNQPFMSEVRLRATADGLGLPLVPRWDVRTSQLPDTHEGWLVFLGGPLSETHVSLDGTAGQMEGLVLRSSSRNIVAKARFEDYAKTLRRTGGSRA